MYGDDEGPAWESSSANRDLCKAAPELIPWGSSRFEPQTGIGELAQGGEIITESLGLGPAC